MASALGEQAATREPTSRGASKAPAAAAAVSATQDRQRARRRQRGRIVAHAHEFMDMNVDVDPHWETAASERAAGPLGFTGAVAGGGGPATGLVTLDDGGVGGGPSLPMLPNSWAGHDAD